MVSDLNKNFGESTDMAKKRHRSADLHSPIHPLKQATKQKNHKPNEILIFLAN